jgi:hypothetical protein
MCRVRICNFDHFRTNLLTNRCTAFQNMKLWVCLISNHFVCVKMINGHRKDFDKSHDYLVFGVRFWIILI